jgi:hypothetical protein
MTYTAKLICHSETDSQAVQEIETRVRWTPGVTLALTYTLKGEIPRLRIPPSRPQRRRDRLWEHTCFEAFISLGESSAYQEFNFSPSGEWAAYAFKHYRHAASLEDHDLAPKMTVCSGDDSLVLDADIDLDLLPTTSPSAVLRLALSAVIEEEPGMLTYWALKHPPGKPDFHHPDAFALELDPRNGSQPISRA